MTVPHASEGQAKVPEEVRDLELSLKQLDRRDWGLWFTVITILLLLCFAMYSLTVPSINLDDAWLTRERLAIGVRGLLALVLLFCVFAIYQQYLIKQFRTKLQEQIAVVSALHSRAETFERLAILDPLTGLFNRRFADELLPREIARAERIGHALIVIMIDLDDFKSINDLHGHAAGDAALEAFARHLKRAIRSADLPVRMGGDEFMVALPDCSMEQLTGPLNRIYGCELVHDGKHIVIKFSVGVAQHQRGESVAQLLERADANMYERKRQTSQ
jgi:diguanylate cyclase (GGDEF)-like protein